jgi:hypothetical protein
MNVLEAAFRQLYPERQDAFLFEVKYSAKFSGLNANIRLRGYKMTINLSRKWEEVNDDIKMGLIQSLLNKVFKTRVKTTEMDLYNIFLKRVHVSIPKDKINPLLKKSFDRLNERYFSGLLETANLVWGQKNFSKLGTYEYGSDTITITSVLMEAPEELLDLVVYHEMLHKKHKFSSSSQRNLHHSSAFKAEERKFKEFIDAEKRLTMFLRRKRLGKMFSWF